MSAPAPPYPANGGSNSRPSSGSSNANGGERVFEHIDDLKRKALSGFNANGSFHQLIDDADRALKQADFLLKTFRRPDFSYVEFLRASEIVVDILPRSKGWADLQMDHAGGNLQKYQVLANKINSLSEQYRGIKEVIVSNNRRSGVQPGQATNTGHARAESGPAINGNDLSGPVGGVKIKPAPSPKPDSLHGRAISTSGASNGPVDPLKDRLAALRNGVGQVDTSRPGSRASTNSSSHNSPISTLSMPNSNDFGGRNSFETATPRPQGPRPQPPPPIPGKHPLDTAFAASMPQPPKATYSPARNMQVAGNIEPPRHTARSLAQTSSRKSSVTSSASSYAPNAPQSTAGGDYFPSYRPASTNGVPSNQIPRRKSVHMPKETRYGVERLYDYLDRYNILLIDFRPRADFDQGHIFARNVMCIDPIHVTYGMSADELLERMVISPEIEQEMFANRDKYDLVIYYDNDTQSEDYLTRPAGDLQTKLKHLHEALLDYNHEKPLQFPPILLIGGIEAWTDLVGRQALITSDTANRVKQGRAIQRRPLRDGAPLRPPKRRLQDYNPLDAEETQKWAERARAESVVLQTPAPLFDDSGQAIQEEPEAEDEELDSRVIQDFNERFPEAGSLDRFAFSSQKPSRAPPEPPPKVPMYPVAPPISNHPTAPRRPAPAAPRMSYTGVSDRAASQNAPVARSTSLVPYIPAKWLSTNLYLPKTGLYNFTATCYMNSLIQALSGTIPMSLHFIEEHFGRSTQVETTKGGSKGIMPSIYMNLIKSLWKQDVNWIKASTFRNFCGRLNSQWKEKDVEQDSKEFFDFLIDVLHEDLNVAWMHRPLPDLNEKEELRRERMPRTVVAKLEWQRFMHRNQSYILSLFGGQYFSRLSFPTCGHTSTTHDFFFSISVEIPNVRYPTLDDCMRSYCKRERLDPEESATCMICKEKRETDKQLGITRAPQFLVIHFKRFRTGTDRKIATPIEFPLKNFDLEPYMLPQPSREETEHIAQNYPPEVAKPDASMLPPYKYDAYAVVRHIGASIERGHYKALVRDPARGVWRQFNDQVHTDFVPGEGNYRGGNAVTNGEAYIVFYQRVLPSHVNANAPIGPGGVGKI